MDTNDRRHKAASRLDRGGTLPHQHSIDAKTLEKLRKVWAMRGSEHAGERAAAEQQAARIVAPFGYQLHHVERLLATNGKPILEAWDSGDRKRRQQQASKRVAVIRRYGSLEAALAWQPREKLLRQAVAHLCTFQTGRPDWVTAIDGWSHDSPDRPSRRVIRLLSRAYPMPASITEAQAEYDYWTARDEDLQLVTRVTRALRAAAFTSSQTAARFWMEH